MAKKTRSKKTQRRNRKKPKPKKLLVGINAERAEWAKTALDAFKMDAGSSGDLQTDIGDLICDLFHLAYREGLSTEAILDHAQYHWHCENTRCRKCKGTFEEFEGDMDKKLCTGCLEASGR